MILVTGAKGVVGAPLIQRLDSQSLPYKSISRAPGHHQNTLQFDLTQPLSVTEIDLISDCDTLIHCAPLWLLPKQLPILAEIGIKRVIAFGSSSIYGKANSSNEVEQQLIANLRSAEQALIESSKTTSISFTIFRPTLIYGYRRDENISRIAKTIRKMGFMPLAGKGHGLRQPIHALDLVEAVLQTLDNPKTYGQVYDVAGAETLTYKEMVKRIFEAYGMTPRFLSLPVWFYRLVLRVVGTLTSFHYTADMANRMNSDLIVDDSQARKDFAFQPQAFLSDPHRDLP